MRIVFKIKEVRTQQNMSLKDVSDKSNVSTSHINDIENQLKMPSLEVMVLISKALKTSIEELYLVQW